MITEHSAIVNITSGPYKRIANVIMTFCARNRSVITGMNSRLLIHNIDEELDIAMNEMNNSIKFLMRTDLTKEIREETQEKIWNIARYTDWLSKLKTLLKIDGMPTSILSDLL